ncbi:MAG TPA: hypothetical protein PKD64_02255 [Pirellulaceae bacterium]|nr:hypothetical protein [Pirellulaceae bacterium]HMO90992.1 hypothetical protein [Pirellulaceae bacterium]HMP68107.1 hypothetical protein [Pirellulaceae bacterium]
MNNQRLLGQILLWGGFLSAALASVSKKEIDLLSDSEWNAVAMLDDNFEIPQTVLDSITSGPIANLSEADFGGLMRLLSDWYDTERNRTSTEATEPPTDHEAESSQKSRPVKMVSKNAILEMRVARLQNKWPTISWLWYGLSALVAIVGIVLLRSSLRSALRETGRVQDELGTLKKALDHLLSNVSALNKQVSKMIPEEVVEYIDVQCVPHYSDFADSRNAMMQKFGMQAFADIMTEFASSERYLNRAWSAAADGYVDEVSSSVQRANEFLQRAGTLFDNHLKADLAK